MNQLSLKILTQSHTIYEHAGLSSITCPTASGVIQILPTHAELVTQLAFGELTLQTMGGETQHFHIDGGFLKVDHTGETVILTNEAVTPEHLDEPAIMAAQKRAQEIMADSKRSDEEYAFVATSLQKTFSKLKFLHKHRKAHTINNESVFHE